MPCIKCANGKYKYGEHGNCQFDTLAACKAAAAAIHINEPSKDDSMDKKKPKKKPVGPNGINIVQPGPHGPIPEGKDMQPTSPHHDATCQCASCKGMYPKYK
jgi:hypothetical protein